MLMNFSVWLTVSPGSGRDLHRLFIYLFIYLLFIIELKVYTALVVPITIHSPICDCLWCCRRSSVEQPSTADDVITLLTTFRQRLKTVLFSWSYGSDSNDLFCFVSVFIYVSVLRLFYS